MIFNIEASAVLSFDELKAIIDDCMYQFTANTRRVPEIVLINQISLGGRSILLLKEYIGNPRFGNVRLLTTPDLDEFKIEIY